MAFHEVIFEAIKQACLNFFERNTTDTALTFHGKLHFETSAVGNWLSVITKIPIRSFGCAIGLLQQAFHRLIRRRPIFSLFSASDEMRREGNSNR